MQLHKSLFYCPHDSIDRISFAIATETSFPLATLSNIDNIPLSLAACFTSSPHEGINSVVPKAARTRVMGSASYLPQPTIVPAMSNMRSAEAEDAEVECMWEAVLRRAVAVASLTFLLLD